MLRAIGALALVIGLPAGAYLLFKWLSTVVSVPVLVALSCLFVFVCWRIANRIDARKAQEGSADNL